MRVLEQLKDAHDLRVRGLLEHEELVLHEIKVYLVVLELDFVNDFDSTDKLGLDMIRSPDFAEGPLPEDVSQLVDFLDVFDLLEASVVVEAEELRILVLHRVIAHAGVGPLPGHIPVFRWTWQTFFALSFRAAASHLLNNH